MFFKKLFYNQHLQAFPFVMIDFVEKVSGKKIQLSFKANAKISEVKGVLCYDKGIKDITAMRLFFNGKEMEEFARLNSYGVEKAEIKTIYTVGLGSFHEFCL